MAVSAPTMAVLWQLPKVNNQIWDNAQNNAVKGTMKKHFTYANIMSTIAVFLALSTGTAFAASKMIHGKKIKRGTVTSKQIKNKTVKLQDMQAASIRTLVATDTKIVRAVKINANTYGTYQASCRSRSQSPLGGGAKVISPTQTYKVRMNGSWPTKNGWRVQLNNTGEYPASVNVYVTCTYL